MICSGDTLRSVRPVEPFSERCTQNGMSFGVSYAGYDIRIKDVLVLCPHQFSLAVSFERFLMPNHLLGIVHDKSTWARRGLACQNTVIEPGWEGFLTLELTNHGNRTLYIEPGDPIAQIVFHYLDKPVEEGYIGKYQNQPHIPVEAILETN